MGTGTDGLKNPSDLTLLDQLTGENSALGMNPFAVVHYVFSTRALRRFPCLTQLLEIRKGRLISKIVFVVFHDAASEWTSLAGNGRCGDEFDRGIVEHLLQALGRFGLRKPHAKSCHFRRIGVVDPPQISARFHQSVALSIDASLIKVRRSEREIAMRAYRRRFAFRGIEHSIRTGHRSEHREQFSLPEWSGGALTPMNRMP